jgi:hypothetical protein
MIKLLKGVWWWAVLVLCVLCLRGIEPFKSHYFAALVTAAVIGVVAGAAERLVRRRHRGSDKGAGPR